MLFCLDGFPGVEGGVDEFMSRYVEVHQLCIDWHWFSCCIKLCVLELCVVNCLAYYMSHVFNNGMMKLRRSSNEMMKIWHMC